MLNLLCSITPEPSQNADTNYPLKEKEEVACFFKLYKIETVNEGSDITSTDFLMKNTLEFAYTKFTFLI